jgi:hypothetical protein
MVGNEESLSRTLKTANLGLFREALSMAAAEAEVSPESLGSRINLWEPAVETKVQAYITGCRDYDNTPCPLSTTGNEGA